MTHNIIEFNRPIKVILHTKEEDNEIIIIDYINY